MRRLFGLRPLGFAAALACVGCSSAEPELPAFLTSANSNTPGRAGPGRADATAGDRDHDFGAILASGQTLEHRFKLANPGPRPLRLLKSEASTPCCSEIGPLPELIPPGGSAEIPVLFRPGFGTGPKRVGFAVATDRQSEPVISFSLAATFLSALEVEFDDPQSVTLPCGQPGKREILVTCRRKGSLGFGAPTSLGTYPPLPARFLSEPSESRQGDVFEVRRRAEIVLPASSEPGLKKVELRLGWGGPGPDDSRPLIWTVSPVLLATPPAIVLSDKASEDTSREIVVRATTGEFRVLAVRGKALAPGLRLPEGKAAVHRLKLTFDRSVVGISDIRVTTDHPDQPVVKFGVLVPSSSKTSGDDGRPR